MGPPPIGVLLGIGGGVIEGAVAVGLAAGVALGVGVAVGAGRQKLGPGTQWHTTQLLSGASLSTAP